MGFERRAFTSVVLDYREVFVRERSNFFPPVNCFVHISSETKAVRVARFLHRIMNHSKERPMFRKMFLFLGVVLSVSLVTPALRAENQVMGEIQLEGKSMWRKPPAYG